ncbi:hypothetical protein VPH35_014748 [Triticum aestivum]
MDVNNHEFSWKYTRLHGAPLGRDNGVRRLPVGLRLLARQGVYAECGDWPDARRVHISGARTRYRMHFDEVVRLLRQGRPVMGGFRFCGPFESLGPNGIYHFQRRRGDVYPPLRHMVLFVGYGRRGGRPYLIFQNSSGRRFGEDGYGRIWFQEVRDFTTFTVRKGTCPTPSQPGHYRNRTLCRRPGPSA